MSFLRLIFKESLELLVRVPQERELKNRKHDLIWVLFLHNPGNSLELQGKKGRSAQDQDLKSCENERREILETYDVRNRML
jgi:hypothetical protein